jgi:single-stranded DNA-binding protein
MTQILGMARLGKNPELKYVGEGEDKKPVCEIWLKMLNVRKSKSNDEEWLDFGFWAQVNLWGNLAEPAARLLTKGDRIYVTGRMVNKLWSQSENTSENVVETETRSTLVVDSDFVAPYLGDLDSLKYKPRKSVAKGESIDESSDSKLAAAS